MWLLYGIIKKWRVIKDSNTENSHCLDCSGNRWNGVSGSSEEQGTPSESKAEPLEVFFSSQLSKWEKRTVLATAKNKVLYFSFKDRQTRFLINSRAVGVCIIFLLCNFSFEQPEKLVWVFSTCSEGQSPSLFLTNFPSGKYRIQRTQMSVCLLGCWPPELLVTDKRTLLSAAALENCSGQRAARKLVLRCVVLKPTESLTASPLCVPGRAGSVKPAWLWSSMKSEIGDTQFLFVPGNI